MDYVIFQQWGGQGNKIERYLYLGGCIRIIDLQEFDMGIATIPGMAGITFVIRSAG